jgi:DNA-binding FadR family transcriptional regulator
MIAPAREVKRVADVLLGRILDGSYPAGLRLPAETSIAAELDCGRSTVREALRHLADLGIVHSRRGSGALVLDYRREGMPALLPAFVRLGIRDVPAARIAREMLHMRALMATEAVRLAARYASASSLAEARACLDRAAALEGDPVAHALNELELYRAFVVASGVWPVVWTVNAMWAPLKELNMMFAPAMGAVKSDFQLTMERIFAAIVARDEVTSSATVRAWFERIDSELVRIIELALGGTANPAANTTQAPEAVPSEPVPSDVAPRREGAAI